MNINTWDIGELKNIIEYCCDKGEDEFHIIGVELILSWLKTKDINLLENTSFTIKKKNGSKNIYYMLEKLTIMCYYVDKYKDLGHILSDVLTLNEINTNQYNINMNKKYYVKKIESKGYVDIYEKMGGKNIPVLKKPKGNEKYYKPCNPSIIKTDEGYICNCRFVNYTQKYAVHFEYLESDSMIRTKNVILIMDKEFNVKSSHKMIDDSWRKNCEIKHKVLGLEDCILFKHKNYIWFSCTTLDTEPYGTPKQNICKLSKLSDDGNYHVTDITVMESSYGEKQMEKNWMPISCDGEIFDDDKIYFIYKHKHNVVFTEYNENNACTIKVDKDSKTISITARIRISDLFKNNNKKYINYESFRGSGGPVKIKYNDIDGYMSIIHEVIFTNNKRLYMHRFVYYDHIFSIKYITPLFYFDHLGIEFCRSMSLSHNENEIIVTVGIEDGEARIYCIDLDTIKNMYMDVKDLTIRQ